MQGLQAEGLDVVRRVNVLIFLQNDRCSSSLGSVVPMEQGGEDVDFAWDVGGGGVVV